MQVTYKVGEDGARFLACADCSARLEPENAFAHKCAGIKLEKQKVF